MLCGDRQIAPSVKQELRCARICLCEHGSLCRDHGVARIRCTNPECGHDYFRPFIRHDRRLFSGGSRLIYDILREFYQEAAGRTLLTGMVIAHQTFGDMLRFNPHFHVAELTQHIPPSDEDEEVGVNARKCAWARLLAKAYELDPLVCPKCGADMKIIAVIEDPDEIKRILRHLVKMGRSPPGFDPDRLN